MLQAHLCTAKLPGTAVIRSFLVVISSVHHDTAPMPYINSAVQDTKTLQTLQCHVTLLYYV